MQHVTPVSPAPDPVTSDSRRDLTAVGRGALGTAGLAGLLYWMCAFASGPEGPSMATATAQQVRDQVATQGTAIQGTAIAGMVGVAAAVVFVAALVRLVRDRLPASLLAEVVLAAGLLVVLYQWLATTSVALTTLLPNLIDSDLESVDDGILQGWYALNGFTHFLGDLAIVPMALLIAAFSLAALRGGLLPRWLAWGGLVVSAAAALGVIGILAEVDVLYAFWFAGLFGYFFWVLAVSVTCLNRFRRSRPTESV